MLHSILVPVDVAQMKAGHAALDLAKSIKKTEGGKIHILHVIEPLPGYVATAIPAEVREKVSRETREELAALAVEQGLGDEVDVIVRHGPASREILEAAREVHAELIVIASHDPGIADYLLGSVAARIVRHAHCSVLVVRKSKN
ncbi:MAG TPA: universal stress protein [Hyphomicrobiales bacterium]|nr:universal stress protein [Rhodobiaceae bacterium]HXK53206.1 universal stress protein [Hyphomicrobiales bacterium]